MLLLVQFLIEILVCLNPKLLQFFSDTSSYPTFVLLFLTFVKTLKSLVSILLSLIYQIYWFLSIKVSIYLQQHSSIHVFWNTCMHSHSDFIMPYSTANSKERISSDIPIVMQWSQWNCVTQKLIEISGQVLFLISSFTCLGMLQWRFAGFC